ncbi:MAG: hypothetical protein WCT03_06965 [Candidatus Obscuribacterales bacterium]
MISKSKGSTLIRSMLLIGAMAAMACGCANNHETKWVPRPRFFTSCLATRINPPARLKDLKGNPAKSTSSKFLYALVVRSFSEYSPMLMLSDNGTVIVSDSESPTGYSYGLMPPIQFEEFKNLGSQLCSLKIKDYGSEIPITDLTSTNFYVTDSLGNYQRIHIYGDFTGNEFFMSDEDKRYHCVVPEVLKDAFSRSMEARKAFRLNQEGKKESSEVWTPENLTFILTKNVDAAKSASKRSVKFESNTIHEPLKVKYTINKSDLSHREIDCLLVAYLENRKVAIHDQLYALTLIE